MRGQKWPAVAVTELQHPFKAGERSPESLPQRLFETAFVQSEIVSQARPGKQPGLQPRASASRRDGSHTGSVRIYSVPQQTSPQVLHFCGFYP